MRNVLLPVLWIGLAGPVLAQPPADAAPAATTKTQAPLSPIGAAMANLSRALHDAAEQARRPASPARVAPADPPSDTAPAARPQAPRLQATAQAALP